METNRTIKTAMILAAGEGTRIRPLTLDTPKVLLSVGGIPLIEHTLLWLKSYGIQEIAINLHYLPEKIRDYLGDGSRFAINVHYSMEENILGTAGGVRKASSLLRETCVIVYGDVLTDFDLGKMIDYHISQKGIATIALMKVIETKDVGVVDLNEEGRVISFREKPQDHLDGQCWANAGIYVIEPCIFNYIPENQFCDFAFDVFPKIIANNGIVYGYMLNSNEYIIDIGSQEKYRKANLDVKSGKVRIAHG